MSTGMERDHMGTGMSVQHVSESKVWVWVPDHGYRRGTSMGTQFHTRVRVQVRVWVRVLQVCYPGG